MTRSHQPITLSPVNSSRIMRLAGWLERVPYALLAIPLRIAVATVFWNSAMTKLANWEAALALFEPLPLRHLAQVVLDLLLQGAELLDVARLGELGQLLQVNDADLGGLHRFF